MRWDEAMTSAVRPAAETDFGFIRQIAGRPENARYVIDEDEAALAAHVTSADSDLVIWDHGHGPAGFALFCELTNPANRAELRRLALAETDRGLGRAFLDALVAYAFDIRGVDRIWLDVAGDNRRAQTLYARTGFTREGTLRRHWRRPAGDVVDLEIFGLLRNEWQR